MRAYPVAGLLGHARWSFLANKKGAPGFGGTGLKSQAGLRLWFVRRIVSPEGPQPLITLDASW